MVLEMLSCRGQFLSATSVHSTRYGWLSWRLALYAVLIWGFWKIWHAPGCKPEYRQLLKRMAIACAVFALACEYSLFGGGLTL